MNRVGSQPAASRDHTRGSRTYSRSAMGPHAHQINVLTLTRDWEPAVAGVILLDPRFGDDLVALVLTHLDRAALAALTRTCGANRDAGLRFARVFRNEAIWRKLCEERAWSWDSLGGVACHVMPQAAPLVPSWLRKLEKGRLAELPSRDPASPHIQLAVVNKVFDALGRAHGDSFLRPSWRRLFEAHCKHEVAIGSPYINEADVAMHRKLRGLQAYLYAEGWDAVPTYALAGVGQWELDMFGDA